MMRVKKAKMRQINLERVKRAQKRQTYQVGIEKAQKRPNDLKIEGID
jgi:hypothetical protein